MAPPDDLKLVPVLSTAAMNDAGLSAIRKRKRGWLNTRLIWSDVEAIYDAMVVAAPGTPAGPGDTGRLLELEAALRRYREEDTDLHRELARLRGEHRLALKREEEAGYARGLRDAAGELGPHLVEILQLCAAGDVDETTAALGGGDTIARAKRRLADYGLDADAPAAPGAAPHGRKPALRRIAEQLEDGDGCGLADLFEKNVFTTRLLTDEEREQLRLIIHWAFVEEVELRAIAGMNGVEPAKPEPTKEQPAVVVAPLALTDGTSR